MSSKGKAPLHVESTKPVNPLLALFTKSRAAILSTLFRYPHRRYYLREMIHISRVGFRSAQEDLQALLAARLITETLEGRRILPGQPSGACISGFVRFDGCHR